jgi:hypothetical protein
MILHSLGHGEIARYPTGLPREEVEKILRGSAIFHKPESMRGKIQQRSPGSKRSNERTARKCFDKPIASASNTSMAAN